MASLLALRQVLNDPNGTFHYINTYPCENIEDGSVDPDIAGIGVMIAAILSTAVTIGYILVGWYNNWIRSFQDHPADIVLRRVVRRRLRQLLHKPPPDPAAEVLEAATPDEKSRGDFKNIILSLSDTQLVTAFALLLSIYIKGDITVYTFRVASTVAWFSSTTHLATLVVLRDYLHKNKFVRWCRISLMIPNAGLLLASQIQISGLRSVRPYAAMHCIDTRRTAFDTGSITFISLWLAFSYINRTINICSNPESKTGRSWVFDALVSSLKIQPRDGTHHWPTYAEQFDQLLSKYQRPRQDYQDFVICIGLVVFLLLDLMSSLFWEILWLFFSLAYGLTGITLAWGECSQPGGESCWASVLEMGLGQMIPLVLLILPIFSILESLVPGDPANIAPDIQSSTLSTYEKAKLLYERAVETLESAKKARANYTLEAGQNPYNGLIGKWIVTSLSAYLLLLFVTAAALSNGAAGPTYAGLIVVLLLLYSTYFFGAVVDLLLLRTLTRRQKAQMEDLTTK